MNTISMNDIALHLPTKNYGRVWAVDHFNKTITLNSAKHLPLAECVYIGNVWKEAWGELAKYGIGNLPPMPPVIVEKYPYKVTVTERKGFYHLVCTYLDYPDPMTNAFLSDFDKAMAIGKALMLACPPNPHYVGYNWDIGSVSGIGWLTFRGQMFDKLPKVFSTSNGYEFGLALFQLGWTIQKQREVMALIERLNTPKELAG